MDKLHCVMNAAARVVSDTNSGLTNIRRNALQWLDDTERITVRVCVLLPPPTCRGALSEYAALAMPRLAHISGRAA